MSIRVKGPDVFTSYAAEVTMEVSLNRVPTASLVWYVDGAEVPTADDLIGQRVEVSVQRDRLERSIPHFIGEIYEIRTRKLGTFRHSIEVHAAAVSAKAYALFEYAASWRVFEKGTSLQDVLAGLLEDAGFGSGLSFKPAPQGETIPDQLIAAGQSAWQLALEVASLHGYATVINPLVEPDASEKFGFANDAAGVGKISQSDPLETAMEGSPGEDALLDLEVTSRQSGTEIVGSWMMVHDEAVWTETSNDQVIVGVGATDPNQDVAKLRSNGRTLQRTGTDVALKAGMREPFVALGDTLSLLDTEKYGGDLSAHLKDALTAISVQWTDSEVASSASFSGGATLLAESGALPLIDTHTFTHDLRILTGVVKKSPAIQGKMKVELDLPSKAAGDKPPIVMVEWISPWLSGAKGGFHFPPIAGDHVALLVDTKPFGRVVYLGAHPSQGRIAKVRSAFEQDEVHFAQHREGEVHPPLSMSGNHLARAIVVGETNVMAWTAPKVGAASDEDIDTQFWQRVKASNGDTALGIAPSKYSVVTMGAEAALGLQSEFDLGLSADNHLTAKAAKLIELTSEEDLDVESGAATVMAAKDAIEFSSESSISVTAKENLNMEATQKAKLDCQEFAQNSKTKTTLEAGQEFSAKGTAKAAMSGAQVEVNADATGTIKGAQVSVEGSAMTTIKGGLVQVN